MGGFVMDVCTIDNCNGALIMGEQSKQRNTKKIYFHYARKRN